MPSSEDAALVGIKFGSEGRGARVGGADRGRSNDALVALLGAAVAHLAAILAAHAVSLGRAVLAPPAVELGHATIEVTRLLHEVVDLLEGTDLEAFRRLGNQPEDLHEPEAELLELVAVGAVLHPPHHALDTPAVGRRIARDDGERVAPTRVAAGNAAGREVAAGGFVLLIQLQDVLLVSVLGVLGGQGAQNTHQAQSSSGSMPEKNKKSKRLSCLF